MAKRKRRIFTPEFIVKLRIKGTFFLFYNRMFLLWPTIVWTILNFLQTNSRKEVILS